MAQPMRWFYGLLLLNLAALLAALGLGSVAVPLSMEHWFDAVWQEPILRLRFARATSAWVLGAALSLAGLLMQTLLRNPLADPYVLGVSSGAAVGALLAMLGGASTGMLEGAAFAGASTITLLLLFFLHRYRTDSGALTQPGLLLSGAMLAAAGQAVITLLLSLAADQELRGMVFWLIGDINGLRWPSFSAAAVVLTCVWLHYRAAALNQWALHGYTALTLGVNVQRLRQEMLLLAALLTASVVTQAGSIGFVGLVIPHAARALQGGNHRIIAPCSVLMGGVFLLATDTLARTLVAPLQLPVGALTALIGVPLFLWQLHRVRT